MVKAVKFFFTALLLSSTFTFANNALAKDCYEKSPNLISLGDQYYNFDDTIKLSNEENNQLQNFLNSLTGKWKGTSTYIECRGPDRDSRKIVESATVKAKTNRASDSKLSINAEKNYTKKRIKKSDNFTLPNIENTYAFALKDNSTLVFSEKYKRSNSLNFKPKKQGRSSNTETVVDKSRKTDISPTRRTRPKKKLSSRLAETIYEITHDNNAFILARYHYTNGVYVAEEVWTLSRR